MDMKTVVFTPRKGVVKRLHIETHGCIVNIVVGLTTMNGEKVTSIEILPDRNVGEEWHLADNAPVNIRVLEGKKPEKKRRVRKVKPS